MKYYVPSNLSLKKIMIAVIGCGGTGGEVMDALTRTHFGLKALGGIGIMVHAYDSDTVEDHNIGRQRFSQTCVNRHKSIALTNRINTFYGFDWVAYPYHFEADYRKIRCYDLIIGCVDKAQFRAELGKVGLQDLTRKSPTLWLDYGNGQNSGQCVLGHIIDGCDEQLRLPNIYDLYPNLADKALDKDGVPRCSLADALTGENGQDLFINRTLADLGMSLLWELLTKGSIDKHGVFLDLATLKSNPLMINPETWRFFGYEHSSAG